MAAPNLDIHRTAYLFVRLHGDAAGERARMIAERMHSKGDHDGADTWLRIIVAIGELGSRGQRRGTETQENQHLAS